MKKALKTIWNWLKPKVTALFILTIKSVSKDILAIINDAELQSLAFDSVKAAADAGLKNNVAFDTAVSGFKLKLKGLGYEFKTSIVETFIQNAYIAFKYETKE